MKIGDIVEYRLHNGNSAGERRPAIIIHTVAGQKPTLKVFCDPHTDDLGNEITVTAAPGPNPGEWLRRGEADPNPLEQSESSPTQQHHEVAASAEPVTKPVNKPGKAG